jgi:hypothetical protein
MTKNLIDMWGSEEDWDCNDSQEHSLTSWEQSEVSEILKELKELKKKGSNMSIEEGKKFTDLQKKLFEKQEACYHVWSVILLFNRHRRFCKWCDKEDVEYVHVD